MNQLKKINSFKSFPGNLRKFTKAFYDFFVSPQLPIAEGNAL